MSSFLLLFLLSTLAFSLLLVPMPANARIAHWDHGHCASSSSESGEMMSGEGPASHQMENGSSSSGFEDEEESGGEDECASNEDEDAIIVFDCYPPPKGRNLQDLPKSRNITAKPNVRVQVRLHCEGPEANERGSLAADVRLDCGGATHAAVTKDTCAYRLEAKCAPGGHHVLINNECRGICLQQSFCRERTR